MCIYTFFKKYNILKKFAMLIVVEIHYSFEKGPLTMCISEQHTATFFFQNECRNIFSE